MVWKGQVQFAGLRDHHILHGNAGAFVWVAAQAESKEHFYSRVHDAFASDHLFVVEIEDAEVISDLDSEPESIADIVEAAQDDPGLIAHSTFHLFKNHDA